MWLKWQIVVCACWYLLDFEFTAVFGLCTIGVARKGVTPSCSVSWVNLIAPVVTTWLRWWLRLQTWSLCIISRITSTYCFHALGSLGPLHKQVGLYRWHRRLHYCVKHLLVDRCTKCELCRGSYEMSWFPWCHCCQMLLISVVWCLVSQLWACLRKGMLHKVSWKVLWWTFLWPVLSSSWCNILWGPPEGGPNRSIRHLELV